MTIITIKDSRLGSEFSVDIVLENSVTVIQLFEKKKCIIKTKTEKDNSLMFSTFEAIKDVFESKEDKERFEYDGDFTINTKNLRVEIKH